MGAAAGGLRGAGTWAAGGHVNMRRAQPNCCSCARQCTQAMQVLSRGKSRHCQQTSLCTASPVASCDAACAARRSTVTWAFLQMGQQVLPCCWKSTQGGGLCTSRRTRGHHTRHPPSSVHPRGRRPQQLAAPRAHRCLPASRVTTTGKGGAVCTRGSVVSRCLLTHRRQRHPVVFTADRPHQSRDGAVQGVGKAARNGGDTCES